MRRMRPTAASVPATGRRPESESRTRLSTTDATCAAEVHSAMSTPASSATATASTNGVVGRDREHAAEIVTTDEDPADVCLLHEHAGGIGCCRVDAHHDALSETVAQRQPRDHRGARVRTGARVRVGPVAEAGRRRGGGTGGRRRVGEACLGMSVVHRVGAGRTGAGRGAWPDRVHLGRCSDPQADGQHDREYGDDATEHEDRAVRRALTTPSGTTTVMARSVA